MKEDEDVEAQVVTAKTRRSSWQPVALEVTASLLAAGAVVMIPLHYVAARVTFFFGAETVIYEEDVRSYWLLVGSSLASSRPQ
jgi:hypothetical protein